MDRDEGAPQAEQPFIQGEEAARPIDQPQEDAATSAQGECDQH